MRKLRFLSDALRGQTVSVAAEQNGTIVPEVTIPVWRNTSTPGVSAEIVIDKRSNLQVAPETIMFSANVSGFDAQPSPDGIAWDEQFHDLDYYWEFDDPGSYDVPENLLVEWRNRNVAYNRDVAHCFTEARTYRVRLTVFERSTGRSATATRDIDVGPQSAAFPGTRTICVSPSGTFGDAPDGAVLVDTIGAALSIANTGNTPRRILLRRGETHPAKSHTFETVTPSLVFDVFGPGSAKAAIADTSDWRTDTDQSKPDFFMHVFMARHNYCQDDSKDITFANIRGIGQWDPVAEEGEITDFLFTQAQAYHQMVGCEFSGFGRTLASSLPGAPEFVDALPTETTKPGFFFADTIIRDWNYYGIFIGRFVGNRVGITGCKLVQDPNAAIGGRKFSVAEATWYRNWHNSHGPMRVASAKKTYIGTTDMFSNNGWGSNKADLDLQPCLRWNTTRTGHGNIMNVERVVAEGGGVVLATTHGTTNQEASADHVLFDKVICLGTHTTDQFVTLEGTGVTIRNMLGIKDNTPGVGSVFQGAVRLQPARGRPNDAFWASRVRIYNCTFVNLMDRTHSRSQQNIDYPALRNNTGNPAFDPSESITAQAVSLNNVRWYPFETGFDPDADGPLDLGTNIPGVTARAQGVRYKNYDGTFYPGPTLAEFDTSFKAPDGTYRTYAPLSGAAALGSANEDLFASFDLLTRDRPQYPARGAMEQWD